MESILIIDIILITIILITIAVGIVRYIRSNENEPGTSNSKGVEVQSIPSIPREEVLVKYVSLGIDPDKIVIAEGASFLWSISRMCLVGGKDQPPALELVTKQNGKKILTYENNRIVNMKTFLEITPEEVKKINSGPGIIASTWTYNENVYRYDFIPTE